MSFLKQILSPFIEFDEKSSQKTETKPNAPVPAPRSINRSPDPVPDDVNTTHPLVDAPGAIKEREAELLFQAAHLQADRGLGPAQEGGGAGEAG